MSELAAFVCGVVSMFCLGAALLPTVIRQLRRREPHLERVSPHDPPVAMARKIERRCQTIDEAKHRLKARAAQLRGLKWEMEQLGAQSPFDAVTREATLGQELYKNRIAKLDEEIYKLRVCESLTDKMLQTGQLILDMLAVEAHVEELMPELMDEQAEVAEQLARFRDLERSFDEVKLRSLAADEVAGLLER